MFVCDAGVIFAQMFVCECAPAAYLFHALLTKFLWSQLDVKGNPMSARLPLQAQNCVCVCVSVKPLPCHSGLTTQFEQ